MNLIDENEEREQEANKKKVLKFIIIAIAALVAIAVILIIYSVVKKNNTLTLTVDGQSQNITSGLFYMEDSKNIYLDENNQMYISVKKLSTLLGVEYYNDEYKNKGEDTTKCYIKTENEYTSYISNSSEIYKAIVVDEQQEIESAEKGNSNNKAEVKKVTEYEYFTVENGVKNIDGEIYASQEAIELGFNIRIGYNKSKKDVTILTLDGLSKIAENVLANKSVVPVIGDECSYQNKKLLKYGLVLIKNAENCYGITNYNNYSDGNNLVSCKYSYVRFCESTGNVIVTTLADSKQGILKIDLNSNTAKVLIEPDYQLIRRMDEDADLYLVKISGKYGIIEIKEGTISTVLRAEYQQIGTDEVFENMQNEYIIYDKYIPVEIDNKWGIVTKNGKMLITPQFPGIGCDLGETGSGDGVIILPELVNGIDGIVFLTDAENKLYSIINVQNCSKIGLDGVDASEIYSVYENNERTYYMKISFETGPAMRVNIYNQFGEKVKDSNSKEVNNTVNNTTTKSNDANTADTNTVTNTSTNAVTNTSTGTNNVSTSNQTTNVN